MLEVQTSNILYRGEDRLDITVKSGDQVFAPTWDMVRGIQQGLISEDEYRVEYHKKMILSYGANRERWEEVLAMNQVVLVCYCKSGTFCHRVILAKILAALGGQYVGELTE